MGLSFAAPLAGRDTDGFFAWVDYDPFQSTRPLRGATSASMPSLSSRAVFQSTRPLRGATSNEGYRRAVLLISIHAPLAGRDNISS